jgi:2-oxoglutarate ferredoxin oxidoreductase subunit gamma
MKMCAANGPIDKKMNIRFCGFGGQGIVLSGYTFGTAAAMDGNNVLQTQSYGSEARGGLCRSDVIISREEIFDLAPPRFDVLVTFSQPAYDNYIHAFQEDGTLIVDDDLVNIKDHSHPRTFKIKATDIAYKKFGRKIMANMVMMGFMCTTLEIISKEALKQSILDNVARGTEKINLEAFEEGYQLGNGKIP